MKINDFNLIGIVIGAAAFLIIAVSRYSTIKAEYWFTKKFWIGFLIIGLSAVGGSLFVHNIIVSTILGVLGFSYLWGIGEIIEQEERVKKGWFPKNERRKN